MRRLIWSRSSVADLRAIDEYLAAFDSAIALRTLDAIRERALLLSAHPLAGPAIDERQRKLTVQGTPYIIIYAVQPQRVDILRIRHGSENWRPDGAQ